jgi:hypothetical protein
VLLEAGITGLLLGASAAGTLASRRHGESARKAGTFAFPPTRWRVVALTLLALTFTVCIAAFGALTGIAIAIAALSVIGAIAVGLIGARARLGQPLALYAPAAALACLLTRFFIS